MNSFLLAYLILCIVHMGFRSENMKWASGISKVLLMPSLLAYYLSMNTDTGPPSLLIALTLLLGTAGDAFLLAGHKGRLLYAGMLCFFVGHLAYIPYFVLHLQNWGYFLFSLLVLAFPLYKIILSFFPAKEAPLMSIYATTLHILTSFCASSMAFIAMDIVEKRTFSKTTIMGTFTLAQLLLSVGILTLQGVY